MLTISNDKKIFSMSAEHAPVATVKPKSTVIFETKDALDGQIKSEADGISRLDWSAVNPATGPLYIEGAKPGDILKVHIKSIELIGDGVMAAIPNAGLLGDRVQEPQVKILKVEDDIVYFSDKIKFPINKMIGVIGVAPAEGSIPCGTPDAHGGNMDNKKITEGVTMYFPVFHEGALLSMGDLHAAMGDGEIMVTGVEIDGKVTVELDVIKGQSINHPILETETEWYTIVSHKDLLEAVKLSVVEMQKFVMQQLELTFNESGMLLSAVGNTEIAQVVDPLLTARFGVPKAILPEIF